jgi:hypothetical protein
MAISYVTQASIGSSVLTLPAGIQANDMIIAFAYRTSTTAMTGPTGYNAVTSTSGNSNRLQVYSRVADGTESGTSLTIASSTVTRVLVYRGVGSVGASAATNGASTTAVVVPAITMTVATGSSWVVRYAATRSTGSIGAITNTTSRGATQSGTSANTINGDTNGGVTSSVAQSSTAGAAATYASATLELIEANYPPTVALSTADGLTTSDTTPTLEFTATDPEANPVRYNVQISNNSSFFTGGLLSSYPISNQNSTRVVSGNAGYYQGTAQSIAAPATGTLDKLQWQLRKIGTPTGNATAKIYAHSGTFGTSSAPTGTALATSATLDVSTLTGTLTVKDFVFSGGDKITLTSGTNYVATIEYSGGDASNYIEVGIDTTTPTATGNISDLFTGSWVTASTIDAIYYLYVDANGAMLIDKVSGTDAGFVNTTDGADTDPFDSAELASFTVGDYFPVTSTATATSFATTVTSMPVNLPSAIIAGNLLVAFSSVRTAGTWALPPGWVEMDSQDSGGIGELTAFYKIADGTEGTTATFTAGTASTGSWHVRKISSWHGTTIPELAKSTSGGVAGSTINPPSLSPSWGSAKTLWLAIGGSAAESITASAYPAGYSDGSWNNISAGGSSAAVGSAYLESQAASDDPGAFTTTASRWWYAMTVGIRPQAGTLALGTYYWRVRASDPTGSNTYGAWTTARSFTIQAGGGPPPNTTNFFQLF